jgi:hypothetical protein
MIVAIKDENRGEEFFQEAVRTQGAVGLSIHEGGAGVKDYFLKMRIYFSVPILNFILTVTVKNAYGRVIWPLR